MISYTNRLDKDVFLLVFHHRLTIKIHLCLFAIDFLFVQGAEGSVNDTFYQRQSTPNIFQELDRLPTS